MKRLKRGGRPPPIERRRTSPLRQSAFARAVLDALPDHIYVKDLQGRYLLVNDAGLRERNVARLEDVVGKTAHDLVAPELAERMSAEDRTVIATGTPLVNREAMTPFTGVKHDDGAARWHITTKIPMRDARGRVIGVLGINRDISDRKRAELALRESEETFRAVFDQAAVGITVVSPQLRYLRVNDRFCEMLGYTRTELLSITLADAVPPEARQEAIDYRRQLLAGTAPGHELRERELLHKDGSRIWVGIATSLVRADNGEPRYFVSVVADISEAKRAALALRESEERFRHLAHYDVLTSLPNRALFYDRLGQNLAQAARSRGTLGLMLIDVDRFKQVNDTLGHVAGDMLLNQVAARLRGAVRSGDTVARLGGDEFAVILAPLGAPPDAGIVAQKIIACFEEPLRIEGTEVVTSVSVGIALFPGDSVEQEVLIKNADSAMYQAKAAGRNCFRFFAPEMNARALQALGIESELRRALERNEFVLHYQPRVNVITGELTGAEALLRWVHPERGIVGPPEFMPLMEESGLVADVGAWVLEAVCAQLERWGREGPSAVPVAANLFPRQFIRRDLGSVISRLLGTYRIDPRLLELEITESALAASAEDALRVLQELAALGVKCSIDDFGTGHCSLGTLGRFPLGALKIDLSFVQGAPHSTYHAVITRAAISLAHSLGLGVVAEGVESQAQLAFLATHGCHQAQGYYFAHPMPAAEFGKFLAGDRRLRAA